MSKPLSNPIIIEHMESMAAGLAMKFLQSSPKPPPATEAGKRLIEARVEQELLKELGVSLQVEFAMDYKLGSLEDVSIQCR